MKKYKPSKQFMYEAYGDGIAITKCVLSRESIVIPEEICGKKVRAVGDGAFVYEYSDNRKGKGKIKKIYIPNTVEYISPTALGSTEDFFDCKICCEFQAFVVDRENKYYCSENGVLYNKDKTVLLKYPTGKGNKRFIVPANVTGIAPYAFMFARFEEISLPKGVTYLGRSAFFYCNRLIGIKLPNVEVIPACSFYECHNLKRVTVGKKLKIIEENAFFNCGIESITLPEQMERIDKYAFMYCKLREVVIPKGLEEISEGVFSRCEMESAVIPDGVKKICRYAFEGCASLGEVLLPYGLLSIEEGAFIGCRPFDGLFVPKSVKRIDRYAFADTCYRDAIVHNETDTDELAFCVGSFNSLNDKEIYISKDVKYISPYAFLPYYYDIEKFVVDPKNKYYYSRDGVVYARMCLPTSGSPVSLVKYPINKKDTCFNVPENVYSIDSNAFYGNRNIKDILFTEGLEYISDGAFRECHSLKSIKLPNSLKNIGRLAFAYCERLTCVILPDGIKEIPFACFYMCCMLERVIFGEKIERIGDFAFGCCNRLKKIKLPDEL